MTKLVAIDKRYFGEIICRVCGKATPRKGASQKYCPECSALKHAEAQRKWDKKIYSRRPELVSEVTMKGRLINKTVVTPMHDTMRPVELSWLCRVNVPFDSAGSKNFIYGFRQGGHVVLRQQVKAYRDLIGYAVKTALSAHKIVHHKIWLDIFIQKPNHQSDAVNFVDTICDAVKKAVGVDDRWFSIRRLDWEVVKENPKIYIGIGQENVVNSQVCSSCGRIRPLSEFTKSKRLALGVTKNCRECISTLNSIAP